MRKDFESQIYRRSRVAARIILKARAGKPLKLTEKRIAARLAADEAITARLIHQAITALCRKRCPGHRKAIGTPLQAKL
jgi:hypothetical protein